MFTCDKCGRKFKTMQALGGHVGRAHPRNHNDDKKVEQSSVIEVTPGDITEPQLADTPGQEPGIMDTIREYRKRGYSARQIKELGYARKTVDDVFLEYIAPENNPEGGEHGDAWALPVTRKQTEVLEPEAIMRHYMDGTPQDEMELRGMMKLRAAMLMVMELATIQEKFAAAEAKRLEPLLKVLREGRDELDAAAARAKASSFEMAQEAARSAVGGVIGYLEEKEARGPKEPPPAPPQTLDETMARRVDWAVGKMTDLMFNTMQQRMFPGQAEPPEGWTYREEKGTSSPQPQPLHAGVPSNWVERKEDANGQPDDVRRNPRADGAGEDGGAIPAHGDQEVP